MQPDWLPFALLALLVVLVLLTLWLALRRADGAPIEAVRGDVQQLERALRDEVARSAGGTRTELAQTLANFQQTLLAQQGDVARTQNEQIDSFRTQLAATQQHQAGALSRSGEQQALSLAREVDGVVGANDIVARSTPRNRA